MTKTSTPVTITGEAVAIVSKYTRFDPANPEATAAHEFSMMRPDLLGEDGSLSGFLSGEGYVVVGRATITVTLNDREQMTRNAVASLQAQKRAVLAEAEDKANELEGRIQQLLAITYQPANDNPAA